MSNTYFQFKQFRIDQPIDGMKVTTDGCIFGALIKPAQEGKILDIGTGTGLLSLMIAQRTNAKIDAIEIHPEVAEQAARNIVNSPWFDQITVLNQDLSTYKSKEHYNQIVCNPPFFKDNHKGKSKTKNTAIHDDTLPMTLLLAHSFELLMQEGSFWVMYPAHEMSLFEDLATSKGFSIRQRTNIYNKQGGSVFRVISEFTKGINPDFVETSLTIKGQDDSYSKEFIHLLKDYYLHL
ncbi:hypothetical protein BFP97_02640 [Roseivirga sp. 4D4]|uniref:tRNA1(Val) (adenine(37)-N6)-methyltransferase n=1 Tax=Roseivirga sp. 4D4 TaxID=1889784 RepID=UPI000852E973|nr:methyltransferase [Roseivirga sp. 4D4]OEK00475.1 hypothetical protein BFP97_02640 [Roseivirga sp. 4D4]